MKGRLKISSLRVLLASTAVLIILALVTNARGSGPISSLLGFISTPMQKVSAQATETAMEFLNIDQMTKDELKAELTKQIERNNQLERELVGYYDIEKENIRLKGLLNIQEEEPDISTPISAYVVGRDPNDVFGGFSIDKGKLAGIEKGDAVITDKGLVGIVSEAYATTSVVKTLFSEEVNVAAMSKKYEEIGVVTSDIMSAGNGVLKMTYLKNDTSITEGTIITTTGAGGVYPKDLVIGYVTSVHSSEHDLSKYAFIQPKEDIQNVKYVMVVNEFPGKGEEVIDQDNLTQSNGNQDAEANE